MFVQYRSSYQFDGFNRWMPGFHCRIGRTLMFWQLLIATSQIRLASRGASTVLDVVQCHTFCSMVAICQVAPREDKGISELPTVSAGFKNDAVENCLWRSPRSNQRGPTDSLVTVACRALHVLIRPVCSLRPHWCDFGAAPPWRTGRECKARRLQLEEQAGPWLAFIYPSTCLVKALNCLSA